MPVDVDMTELGDKFWDVQYECFYGLHVITFDVHLVSQIKIDRFKKTCPLDCLFASGRNGKQLSFDGTCRHYFLFGCFPVKDTIKQYKCILLETLVSVGIVSK